jgi:hypothetical protein
LAHSTCESIVQTGVAVAVVVVAEAWIWVSVKESRLQPEDFKSDSTPSVSELHTSTAASTHPHYYQKKKNHPHSVGRETILERDHETGTCGTPKRRCGQIVEHVTHLRA